MAYLLLKVLHVVSVVAFLGNIVTGLFWAAHAHRSRNFPLIASTFEGIIRSDRYFTNPGVVGILVSGVAAAIVGGIPILRTGWVFWPIVLFTISGAAFGLRIAPLQRRLAACARAAASAEGSWPEYEALYRRWELWGLVAIATPLAALIVMVLKPGLPGL